MSKEKETKQLTEVEALAKIKKVLDQLPTTESRKKVLAFLNE